MIQRNCSTNNSNFNNNIKEDNYRLIKYYKILLMKLKRKLKVDILLKKN